MTTSNDESKRKGNGRVDISGDVRHKSFPLYETTETDVNRNVEFSVRTLQTSTPLSDLFFSRQNLDILQNSIRKAIYDKTDGKSIIDRQSDIELEIVMRSIYLQYSQNRDDNLISQVEDLNLLVQDYCIPIVYSNMLQYMQYKKDISELPVPLQHSVKPSIKGDKSLMLNPFF